jgi:hypothetical protein
VDALNEVDPLLLESIERLREIKKKKANLQVILVINKVFNEENLKVMLRWIVQIKQRLMS